MRDRLHQALRAFSGAAILMVGLSLNAAPALADYGAGATYQVEVSANPPGFGIWLWAELSPGGSGDYQETDCIHQGGGSATDGAVHDSGSVTGWTIANGHLTMTGVKIIGGLETATFSIPVSQAVLGHYDSVTVTITSAIVPIIPVGAVITLPAQVQVAP